MYVAGGSVIRILYDCVGGDRAGMWGEGGVFPSFPAPCLSPWPGGPGRPPPPVARSAAQRLHRPESSRLGPGRQSGGASPV